MKERGVYLNAFELRSLRKSKGLSQEDLARESLEYHCPISSSSIKRAELGKKVSYRTARNISLFYNISLSEILYLKTNDSCIESYGQNNDGVFCSFICWSDILSLTGTVHREKIKELCLQLLELFIDTDDEEIRRALNNKRMISSESHVINDAY